jgi:hypothetical protein
LVENRSGASDIDVTVNVSGRLACPGDTCAGGEWADTYAESFRCSGGGVLVECGSLVGLRPGRWINRLEVVGTPQVQARRAVFVAGTDVANALVWTVYRRTLVVTAFPDREASLREQLAQAEPGSLVIFSKAIFPGAGTPQTITLGLRTCDEGAGESDDHDSGLCFSGSDVVVDALDENADPGAVALSAGAARMSVLRVFGSGNVFRGLVFDGSDASSSGAQADTVSFVGSGAKQNRLERCVVRGPASGDTVSVEKGGGPSGDDANVIERCELLGGEDKGLKVTEGGRAVIVRSCVHGNRNGGVQATLGGHALAIENVVQRNVPGRAQNGLSVRGTAGDGHETSTLVTHGNIVRFSGGRGLSVTDDAVASFNHDYVADSGFVGSKVETTPQGDGAVARASFRGVALVCNGIEGLSGTCQPAGDVGIPCGRDADCCTDEDGVVDPACTLTCGPGSVRHGFGADQVRAVEGAPAPDVDYGTASDPGQNAFTLNPAGDRDPDLSCTCDTEPCSAPAGANFRVGAPMVAIPAVGNQWQHCCGQDACDPDVIAMRDIHFDDARAAGASVDLGVPPVPSAGVPVVRSVSPPRPRRGELVRVFGENFNAIGGAHCAGATAPVEPCSAENPAVRQQNQQSQDNRLRITAVDGTPLSPRLPFVYPDAVTPTMLAFHMPFDCFAPLTLEIEKQNAGGGRDRAQTILCAPHGCAGLPAGTACDDGNACTSDDRCIGGEDGVCAGTEVQCAGACLTGVCHPVHGCEPQAATTSCDDADACTVGDHCSGEDAACLPGLPRVCAAPCLTGACDSLRGCLPEAAGSVCRQAAGACDVAERCDGLAADCPPDVFRPSTIECRPAAPVCDRPEHCDGVGENCPPDGFAPATAACDDGDACTVGDHCAGDAADCVAGDQRMSCDDGDPCTPEQCADGACVAAAITPVERVVCELGRLPVCGEDTVAGVAATIEKHAVRARSLIASAASVTGRQRAAFLRRAGARLRAVRRATTRAARAGRIGGECAAAIRQRLDVAAAVVRSLKT